MKDTRTRDIRSAVMALRDESLPGDLEEAREAVREYVRKRAARLYHEYRIGQRKIWAYREWKLMSEETSIQAILDGLGHGKS